ncbi:MAG TPA: PAS domain S-box protein, partial [Ignavibacteriaceae bacterium]
MDKKISKLNESKKYPNNAKNNLTHLSSSDKKSYSKNAIDGNGEAVLVVDTKWKIIKVTAASEKLLGFKINELIDKSFKEIFKYRNKNTTKQKKNLSNRESKTKLDLKPAVGKLFISKSNSTVFIIKSIAPIKNKTGNLAGYTVTIKDHNRGTENWRLMEKPEQKIISMLNNLPGFVYRFKDDKNRTIEFISSGCKKLTGYSANDFINKKILFNDLIPTQYQKQILSKRQKAVKQKIYFELEYPIITKSGNLNWIWERGKGVYSDKGKLLFIEGFIEDISNYKNTESLLKESENRYKSFFNSSPDAIFLADPETGKIIDANEAALNLLKMPYSKVIGIHQAQLHPKRLISYSKSTFSKHLNESNLKIPFENFVLTSDGKEIPVEVLASVLNLNGKKVLQGVFRNITERRKIEKALAESENKFKLIFEHSKDAMLLFDGKVFFDCNNSAVELMGCASKDQILSMHPAQLSPKYQPDGDLSLKKAKRLIKQAYTDGVAKFEWVHKKINDEEFPVEVTLTSVPISGKQILFTIWRDISERKIFESEIQKSKDRMQLLVEGTPHLFFYVQDLEAKIQYISPSVENITGYTVNEWMQQNHWYITDSPINTIAKTRTHAHLKGEVNLDAVYVEIFHSNGSKVMLEVYEKPIMAENKVIGLQGVAHDITDRIRFEDNLKQSELSYKGLFESVSESIYIQDENGVFLDVNEGACRMYGYDKKTLIGKTPDFVSAPGKNNIEVVSNLVQKAFSGEKQQFEFWGKRKNGEIFLKDVRLYPGMYFNQKVIIAIANDITERKKAEDLIKESEE